MMFRSSDSTFGDTRMRNGLLLLGVLLCVPALPASDSVTVAALEQQVSALHSKSDQDAAHRIARFTLTERLNPERLHALQVLLPGDKSRLALLTVADASAFLDLPRADYGVLVAPSAAVQGEILNRAAAFVSHTMPRMPDFLATRKITRLQSLIPARATQHMPLEGSNPQPFRLVDRSQSPVSYQNGKEVVDVADAKSASKKMGLVSWGEFGPLLQVAMVDILQNKVGWSYWEKTSTGLIAVFRYQVSTSPHYTVRYCCTPSEGKPKNIEFMPPYHGEIAIDPDTGRIARLVVQTDLNGGPLRRADVAVEYGPVQIGGSSYICPLRSIALSTATSMDLGAATPLEAFSPRGGTNSSFILALGQVTAINDVAFEDYHMFRGEMRIVPETNDVSKAPQF
jgi:hypothetical protein